MKFWVHERISGHLSSPKEAAVAGKALRRHTAGLWGIAAPEGWGPTMWTRGASGNPSRAEGTGYAACFNGALQFYALATVWIFILKGQGV